MYGGKATVYLDSFLRNEVKFTSPSELSQQISDDIEKALQILSTVPEVGS